MSIYVDANILIIWDEQFARAREQKESKIHLNNDCKFGVWTNWRFRRGNYPCFILIRYCTCGERKNRLREYEGSTVLAQHDFNKDGLEVHIDEQKRCRYDRDELTNGTFSFEKVCYCKDTRAILRMDT